MSLTVREYLSTESYLWLVKSYSWHRSRDCLGIVAIWVILGGCRRRIYMALLVWSMMKLLQKTHFSVKNKRFRSISMFLTKKVILSINSSHFALLKITWFNPSGALTIFGLLHVATMSFFFSVHEQLNTFLRPHLTLRLPPNSPPPLLSESEFGHIFQLIHPPEWFRRSIIGAAAAAATPDTPPVHHPPPSLCLSLSLSLSLSYVHKSPQYFRLAKVMSQVYQSNLMSHIFI